MDRLLRARVMVGEAQALGLSVQDLVTAAAGAPATREDVPTVSGYLRRIEPTFSKGTQRTYRSYWRLAERHFGDRRIDTISVDDCEEVVLAAAERARKKRPGSDARSPRENCVAALRALFERARRAKYVLENPAAEVGKPRRLTSRRRGLDERELPEAIEAVRMTSRDIELDLLLVRFHLVSGARQEGALNVVLDGIDDRRCTVWLREKYGKEREQPIPPSLVPILRGHARRRGATRGSDKVFCTNRGVPTSRRHYDRLFRHVQDALPWSVRIPVTAHVLRHTAASAIERISGSIAVAEMFLGHESNSVTATYTEARLEEVAAADDAIVLFAVSGPGVDPDLEPGTVRKAGGGGIVAWDGGGDRFIGTRRPLSVMNGEGVAAVILSTDPGAAVEALGANPSRSVFGNAGAFDDVAIDVYVAIAQRFGAQVVTVEEAFARADLRRTLDCLDRDEEPEARAVLIDHALELTQQHPALAEEARAAGLPVAGPAPAADQLRRLDAVRSTEPPTLGL